METSAPEIAAEIARRGFERLLLFTDGVVAIAVTLLILPVVDDVLRSDPHTTTLALLRQLENELFGFGLSRDRHLRGPRAPVPGGHGHRDAHRR